MCEYFNGAPSQGISSVEKSEIGSRVLPFQRDETKSSFNRGNNRFSLFKWLKRSNCDSSSIGKRRRRVSSKSIKLEGQNLSSSSTESVSTFYSTTTVHSFAFQAGVFQECNDLSLDDFPRQLSDVGPFGSGAVKLLEKGGNSVLTNTNYTTLPNTFSQKRDITERYSLQPSNSFNSCGNIPNVPVNKWNKSCNSQKGKKVHVKGKRRAPNPPDFKPKSISSSNAEQSSIKTKKRTRRQAPRPPDEANLKVDRTTKINCAIPNDQASCPIISNDTLILRGGILLPKKENKNSSEYTVKNSNINSAEGTISDVEIPKGTENQSSVNSFSKAMPRPWYKRSDSNTANRGDVFKSSTLSTEKREECTPPSSTSPYFPFEGSLSKLNFFHRTERNSEDKRKEVKRKSGISILTNISELDKEAAAIVQEEQARLLQNNKVTDVKEDKDAVDKEIVQDMVASAVESSPRRSTRALISKFNAITNLSKVTVNTNYFAKNSPTGQRSNRFDLNDRIRGPQSTDSWLNDAVTEDEKRVKPKQDLSRYFKPHQRSPKLKSHFNQNKIDSTKNDNRVEIVEISHVNLNTPKSSDIPGKKESKDDNLSSFNKYPPLKSSTNSSFFKFDKIEKVPKDLQKANEQKSKCIDKEISGIENASLLSFNKKPFETKIFHVDNNASPTMIKELDLIFNEIDKQLENNIMKNRDNNLKREVKAGTSNQASQILSILIESEKTPKKATSVQRSIDETLEKEKVSELIQSQSIDVVAKEKDLKEILKEMKHSLPKRSKAKKIIENHSQIINVNNKPSTSAFNDLSAFTTNLKDDILEKPKPFLLSQEKTESDMREEKKQKVSSAVQTSGNVRKVSNLPSTSKQNTHHDIMFTSRKSEYDDGAKLKLNKFHLIRPKEFDQIEAIKFVKTPCLENIYANVAQQPSCYNKIVLPLKPVVNIQSSELLLKKKEEVNKNNQFLSSRIHQQERLIRSGTKCQQDNFNDIQKQKNMNTLAVNKLLKKLEAAIASGNHHQASMLAKELAQLKIQCSVIRQRSINKIPELNINMYIENKEGHQGPIPLLLPLNMTVAQLKAKIFLEFEIPTNIQRWIIGKNLADNEDATLEELQTTKSIFLYLVAPEMTLDDASQPEKSNIVEKIEKSNIKEVELLPEAVKSTEKQQERPAENLGTLNQVKERSDNISEEIKLERYEELMSLENCDLIPNSEPIDCPICFITYGPQEGITLRDCLHTFCRPCITNTIVYCEEAEVRCPYRDSVYTCESTLQEREIKALVAPEVYQQHLAKSIAQAENNAGNNAFHCKTPDCPGWCIYDDNVNNFLCPVCHMNNCLTCQFIHIGKNCRQHQEELRLSKETDQESKRTAAMLEEMVNRGEALPCPTCAVILMKKWGCDWLRCSMCKTEICWVTRGPRWGPAGKGDTSGGCKCGENGIKCHPRCNYCH